MTKEDFSARRLALASRLLEKESSQRIVILLGAYSERIMSNDVP